MAIPRFNVTTQDAYNYLASKFFADQQLCMVLKLDGEVKETALAEATRLTMDLEPVLGCRLVVNGDDLCWKRRSCLDQLKTLASVDNEQALLDFINQPLDATVDPLVSAITSHGKNGDTVCVKVNHSACDAGGLKEYVTLLSNVYNSLVTNGKTKFKPNLSGRRDQSQLFEHTKDPRCFAMKGFPRPTWTFPQKMGTQRLHAFRSVSPANLEAIKKLAHSKKATVNDTLLTALYRTFFNLNNTPSGKPMLVQVSIDLRRHLPNCRAEAICNLSGALYTALERRQGEPFEITLGRVSKLMNKLKSDYAGVESAAGLEYLLSQGFTGAMKYLSQSAEMGKRFNVTFPLLSNFGVLSDYRFGELHTTQGYISSPIMYTGGFMLGATTFSDAMTLSVGFCGKKNSDIVEDFLDKFIRELPS